MCTVFAILQIYRHVVLIQRLGERCPMYIAAIALATYVLCAHVTIVPYMS